MNIDNKKEKTDEKNNKIRLKRKKTNMLLAAFMIFIFPIIAIFVGAFIGSYIGNFIEVSTKTSEIIGGVIGFVLSAVIIKLFDKHSKIDENLEKIYWDDL
ncbi:Fis family transcriptional regulator [Clostridium chromiireducens]|uniref:Fis family transcriptional regulator n=1 Tax=Clostridium chromiireducens TaxID=225345 RepID=A0A964RKN0_9CLOT|nr:SoxR reducing system RseC family protein [Clostridium chromiireducens]MVX63302.1 Fis family transcriptional regulator [Clostridium chromiireducens]